MVKNIEIQYFDGQNYEILYPSTLASLISGTLSDSQIPNLNMSKITSSNLDGSRVNRTVSNSSKVGGYTYNQIINNAGGSQVRKITSYTIGGNYNCIFNYTSLTPILGITAILSADTNSSIEFLLKETDYIFYKYSITKKDQYGNISGNIIKMNNTEYFWFKNNSLSTTISGITSVKLPVNAIIIGT